VNRDQDQAWFWTDGWQAGEREADADIAAGRTSGPFVSIDEMFASLGVAG
jgi:antitoxin PrlF